MLPAAPLMLTRLEAAVRPGRTVARFGGDEFAVLLEGMGTPDSAAAVAERMVSSLRQPLTIDGQHLALSVSVGVAVAHPGSTTELLLGQADSAMYEAKVAGKDRFKMFAEATRTRSGV